MLDESVGTKADDGSPRLYDRVDVSAAAVGHVDIEGMRVATNLVGVGAANFDVVPGKGQTFGEMTRPFLYHEQNISTRIANKL